MKIFDDLIRSDGSAASHSEGIFAFLNRVHTPYWASVRSLIEEWFSHLSPHEGQDVRARLRCRDDRQFHAAFWELYLHESLIRSGYRVTCHPELADTSRRPDFLVEGGTAPFYLEARAPFASNDEAAAERRRNRIYDVLDRLSSPNFFLWLDIEGEGNADPPIARLRKPLEAWLATLDPDEISRELETSKNIDSAPFFEWRDSDWFVIFRSVPKSKAARGSKDVRPLGVFGPGSASITDESGPIKKALRDKGHAYGSLSHPFLIALRTSVMTTLEWEIMNALYGDEQVQISLGANGVTRAQPTRAPNGYWYGGTEWKHRHVSGVLILNQLQPLTVAKDVATLWLHPDPEREAEPLPISRQAVSSSGSLQYIEPTLSPHAVFGLPSDWPGGDPFAPFPSHPLPGS